MKTFAQQFKLSPTYLFKTAIIFYFKLEVKIYSNTKNLIFLIFYFDYTPGQKDNKSKLC